MRAVAKSKKFAKKVGVSQSVGAKFMAKDKNGQYKVKTETLKSMGKRLKEKMKKKK